MALDLEVHPPAWMTHEIDHIRTIGDEATKTLNNSVALGSALLQQKQQRESMATNALEQQRTQQDMEEMPVWLAEHPDASPADYNQLVPKSRWGQMTKQAAWQMSYQQQQVKAKQDAATARAAYEKGMIQNGSEQAKIDLDISKKFTDGINSIPIETDDAAAAVKKILLMPRGPGGGPTPEAITALGQLKAKYPPATKPSAQTNEGKNIDLINRLKKAGDTEGAALIENILKARGHLGSDKTPSGKLSETDKIRAAQAKKEVDRADAALDKLTEGTDEYNKKFQDKINAQAQLDQVLNRNEKPSGSKSIKAPSVKTPDKPGSDLSPDDFNNWLKKRQETTD